jgi:hypothetical protein
VYVRVYARLHGHVLKVLQPRVEKVKTVGNCY